jgi:hypothetical protein
MMLQWKSIPDRLGLTFDDVQELLTGRPTANVCSRLRLSLADASDFIGGRGDSASLTELLDIFPMAAATEFIQVLSREQRIGLLFGLLLRS